MTGKVKQFGLALLGALLALTSCRDLALEPVFYALSTETPLGDNRGFPDESMVFKMVKSGSQYFAAANTLYTRTDGPSDTWTVVDPPPGLANAMCNTLEILGTQIYAGFYNYSTGTGYGLYTAALGALPLAWTEVTTEPDDVEITLLKTVGGQLFTATNTNSGNVNALYYGDGTAFTAVTWTSAPAADIGFIDVAQAAFDGSYWVLVGAYLYQSAALPGPFTLYSGGTGSPPASPLSGPPTSGGLFHDGTALYVSAGNGHLYCKADGGTNWTRTVTAFLDDKKDFATRFTSFAAPAADAGTVYVGTQGQGYFRIPGGDVTGVTGTLTREPSYNITALYTGALNQLFYDDDGVSPQRLFLCTNGSGLWRGEYAGSGIWTWKQE